MSFSRRHLFTALGALLLLSAAPGAHAQNVNVADLMAPGPLPDRVLGPEKAPVTVVEYASMTCSHCARFHTTVYPDFKKKYIDSGKVRFMLREFPLDPIAAGAFDELVRDLRSSLGLTVFMVTHDLDSLFAICDRVAVLVDKKLRVGTLEQLLNDDHPWIRSYFHGPRGLAAQHSEAGSLAKEARTGASA